MELSVTLCADHGAEPIAEVMAGDFAGTAEHLAAGTWQLTTTRGAVLSTGGGDVLNDRDFSHIDSVLVERRRDGATSKEIVFSGDVLGPGDDPGGREFDQADRLVIRGHEAFGILSIRMAYPDWSREPDEGWVRGRAVARGKASNRAAHVVEVNMGGAALEGRQIPNLFVSTDDGGLPGAWMFTPEDTVADLVAHICAEGEITCNVLFDPYRNGYHVRFREPTDWSDTVTFTDQGDLVELKRGVSSESATVVIASREFDNDELSAVEQEQWRRVERGATGLDVTGWRRVEKTIRSAPGEAFAEGRTLLREGRRKSWVSAIPIVDDQHAWASEIMLGDLVGVRVEGEQLLLPVQQFDVQWSSSGSWVRPVLGAPSQRSAHLLARRLRRMDRRITRIPRTLLEGGPVDDMA